MQRELGAFETALTLSDELAPLNVVAVLRLAKGPPPEALRRALEGLQARHPLLGTRIVSRDGRYYYDRRHVPSIPLRRAERDGKDAWIREAEAELNDRLDAASGPLLRCVVLSGSDGDGEILVTFHHAIMDAASAVSLCRELLAACAAADSPPIDAESLAMLPAAEDLFPPPWQGWRRRSQLGRFLLRLLSIEVADRWRARGRWHAPAAMPTRCRILSFQLSPAETTALVRRSRRQRVTLHSVCDAALLQAVARRLYRGQSLPLRHLVFANLRPYLKPPVAAEDLGSYFAMLRFTTSAHPDRDVAALAREINSQVHAAAERGEKYAFSLTSAMAIRGLIRFGSQRMAATALSYTGSVRTDAAGPYPVRGLHAFVSNFSLGPEYTAQVRLYAGRLWWDILYLDSDMAADAAQQLAEEIRHLLVSEGDVP